MPAAVPHPDTCPICQALLNEALDLTVRGRTLDSIQRRADTLAVSKNPEGWQRHGVFDRHVEYHNANAEPYDQIETRSLTPTLWAEEQFSKDLYEWEQRARKHMIERHP
jgi:hypothetical protein